MDRQTWLAERRSAVVAAYDELAPAYDEHEYPSDLQREWVARVLRLIPPGGIVLDAPCGTGKCFAMVAAAGHQVAGVDQSAGMLAQARARGIAVQLEQAAGWLERENLTIVDESFKRDDGWGYRHFLLRAGQ